MVYTISLVLAAFGESFQVQYVTVLPEALKARDGGVYDAEGEKCFPTIKTQGYSVRCIKD
jgi:hypothetical protein